jgi:hypothetical protein
MWNTNSHLGNQVGVNEPTTDEIFSSPLGVIWDAIAGGSIQSPDVEVTADLLQRVEDLWELGKEHPEALAVAAAELVRWLEERPCQPSSEDCTTALLEAWVGLGGEVQTVNNEKASENLSNWADNRFRRGRGIFVVRHRAGVRDSGR